MHGEDRGKPPRRDETAEQGPGHGSGVAAPAGEDGQEEVAQEARGDVLEDLEDPVPAVPHQEGQERRSLGFDQITTTAPCLETEEACPYTITTYSQELAAAGISADDIPATWATRLADSFSGARS